VLREGETFVVCNLGTASKVTGTTPAAAAASSAVVAAPLRGVGRDGGTLELAADRSQWLKARPGIGALCGLVSGYAPRRCVPLAALGATQSADGESRVAEARRAAAVAAASRGGGAVACNAAACEAAAAAAADLPPLIAAKAHFDAAGVLVHAAAVQPNGYRGQRQYGFFVDESLVQSVTQPGAEVDPYSIELVALLVRRAICISWSPVPALTTPLQLDCKHEGGVQPWPADAPDTFPVVTLQHAAYVRHDEPNCLRVAQVCETSVCTVLPKFLAAPGVKTR